MLILFVYALILTLAIVVIDIFLTKLRKFWIYVVIFFLMFFAQWMFQSKAQVNATSDNSRYVGKIGFSQCCVTAYDIAFRIFVFEEGRRTYYIADRFVLRDHPFDLQAISHRH